jgi:hydroxymethylpyrimidine/phosphomethylpyrimidine kinase
VTSSATSKRPIALTIAGSDSSGGAGIQADIKTFTVHGVYGASVITALTAQNTLGVRGVHAIPPDFVALQLAAVLEDLEVGATKTGMLANAEIIEAIAQAPGIAAIGKLVVDPVMIATSGDRLLEPSALEVLRGELLPRAALVTPNLQEAALLCDQTIADTMAKMEVQGRRILDMGCEAVLIKGGHGEGEEAVDLLFTAAGIERFAAPRIATRHTHGSGCTLSAAITANLARGLALERAVGEAKAFVSAAIASAAAHTVGRGVAPLDHLVETGD